MTTQRSLTLLLLCLASSGCGLNDYVERMHKERDRIQVFDDENRYLDELIVQPMGPPAKKGEADQPVWPFPVMLRLPAGVSGRISGEFKKGSASVPLFRYSSKEGLNIFVAAGFIGEEDPKEKVFRPGEWSVPEFRRGVRVSLREFYNKTYNANLKDISDQESPEVKQPRSWRGVTLPEISYSKVVANDAENKVKEHWQFELYFHQRDNRQAAIIIQTRLNEPPNQAIDWCLKSLDISDQATARREEVERQRARMGRKT
jgi:hypothetical protein